MIDVKMPILLDSNLNDSEILYPTKGSLTLNMTGASECSLTLPIDSVAVPMHAWVKIFNQNGFVGIFRRTSGGGNYPNDQSCALKHGIDILQDSLWQEETEFTGTKTQFLTALLNQQTQLINGVKPWVLGSCADSSSFTDKKINYDNLLDLLEDMEEDGGNYYFTYDQTVWPWQLNYVAKSSAVASEFRLRRNMEKVKISENDSELCTRLILNVNAMTADASLDGVEQNQSVMRVYNNTAAQALYGVVTKTTDIDTSDSLPSGPFTEADAYAQKFLADRAAPLLQIQVDGSELYRQTGDTWDESRIGTMCRVALPDYGTYVLERLVTVTYPDFLGKPSQVSDSLANSLPKVTKSVNKAQKQIQKNSAGGRGSARKEESFVKHFQITDDNNNILKQAGMRLDANGLLVYADDNQNMIGSRFNVQADKIGMVVGTNQDGNYIKAGEIALSINNQGESAILLSADIIDIDGLVTALAAKNIGCGQLHVEGAAEFLNTIYCEASISAEESIHAGSGFHTGRYTATWQSASYVTYSLGTYSYFLYGSSSTSTSASGARGGYLVTGSSSHTIYYLGHT